MEIKKCSMCPFEGTLDNFSNDKRLKSGKRSECKSCQRQKANRYYQENREKVLNKQRQYGPKWKKANKDKVNQSTAKRRALIKGSTVDHVDYKNILERDGMWCYLGGHVILGDYEFDHIEPVINGGEHAENNISVVCPLHNRVKGKKSLLEYMAYVA